MEELSRVIGWIEELSPKIWAIYVRRQYIGAFVNLGWAILLLVCVLGCWRAATQLLKPENNKDVLYDEVVWVPVLLGAALFIISIVLLAEFTWSFLTPEYRAIRDLLSVVK
jgi:hypothetical protein